VKSVPAKAFGLEVGAEEALVFVIVGAADPSPSLERAADKTAWLRMHMQGVADDFDSVVGQLTGCLYTLMTEY
jgi:hypothetical protein